MREMEPERKGGHVVVEIFKVARASTPDQHGPLVRHLKRNPICATAAGRDPGLSSADPIRFCWPVLDEICNVEFDLSGG